jgi:septal ring factor EnvC (AmiA/AmiB activator)
MDAEAELDLQALRRELADMREKVKQFAMTLSLHGRDLADHEAAIASERSSRQELDRRLSIVECELGHTGG